MKLRGISFPFRKEAGQFPVMDEGASAVRSNVIALFNLPLRGRVMRPELGTTVSRLLFEPIDGLFFLRMETAVRATIERGEPRASVISINIQVQSTTVIVDIIYAVNGVQDTATVTMERTV
jgi:phage baseplate assembly protein W